jgi:hypothetical protein
MKICIAHHNNIEFIVRNDELIAVRVLAFFAAQVKCLIGKEGKHWLAFAVVHVRTSDLVNLVELLALVSVNVPLEDFP